MSMINSLNTMHAATMAAAPSQPAIQAPKGDQATMFNKLLFAGTPQGDVDVLTPAQMLTQQVSIMGAVTGVDLGAKVAGAVSQSVNKLANMT